MLQSGRGVFLGFEMTIHSERLSKCPHTDLRFTLLVMRKFYTLPSRNLDVFTGVRGRGRMPGAPHWVDWLLVTDL